MPESTPPAAADNITIVGAGHAGVQAADTLRRAGFTGHIVLLNAEPHLPYQRPPLSKKLLSGELPPERAVLKAPSFYEQSKIELLSGWRVDAIDPANRALTCASADATAAPRTLHYGQLLLCLGSEPRRLDLPGAALAGIHYMRTLDAPTRSARIAGRGPAWLWLAAVTSASKWPPPRASSAWKSPYWKPPAV